MWALLRSVKSSGLRAVWSAFAVISSLAFLSDIGTTAFTGRQRLPVRPIKVDALTALDVSRMQFHYHTKLLHFAPCCRERNQKAHLAGELSRSTFYWRTNTNKIHKLSHPIHTKSTVTNKQPHEAKHEFVLSSAVLGPAILDRRFAAVFVENTGSDRVKSIRFNAHVVGSSDDANHVLGASRHTVVLRTQTIWFSGQTFRGLRWLYTMSPHEFSSSQ